MTRAPDALRVSQVVAMVRDQLHAGFRSVWVEGEVSNLRPAASGHVYFSLKDATSQLAVVMFRSRVRGLRFELAEGLSVVVRGAVTVFEPRGSLQLVAEAMLPLGHGEIARATERLKARLHAEGLFLVERKRPLPARPRRVGVVTSETGAALHDILQVLSRRQASLKVLLAPARVQGAGAAAAIAAAVAALQAVADLDVIIVGRGGGSQEDLHAFNDERVARAIAASRVPVISAVGHEIDVTIADLVADVRAPTPSAAAEMVARSTSEARADLRARTGRLLAAMVAAQSRRRLRLASLASTRTLRDAEHLPARLAQRLDDLQARLLLAARRSVERRRRPLDEAVRRLAHLDVRHRLRLDRERLGATAARLVERAHRQVLGRRQVLGLLASRLDALSPLGVLGRGYAIATGATGRILRRATEAAVGERIHVRLADGELACRVEGGGQ